MNASEQVIMLRGRVAQLNSLLIQLRREGGGGGGGTFIGLTDTPASYVGQAARDIRVNAGENALEFVDRIDMFADLSDGPGVLVGHAGDFPRVNVVENALEYGFETAVDAGKVDGYDADDFLPELHRKRWRAIIPYSPAGMAGFFVTGSGSWGGGGSFLFEDTTWQRFASSAVAGQGGDIFSSNLFCSVRQNFIFRALIRPQSNNDCRFWVGMSSIRIRSAPAYNTDNPTCAQAIFRYSQAIGANWYACTRDGGVQNAQNTGVACNTNTVYDMMIVSDYAAGEIDFYINGALIATSNANLPSSTTGLLMQVAVITIAGGAGVQTIDFSYEMTEHD